MHPKRGTLYHLPHPLYLESCKEKQHMPKEQKQAKMKPTEYDTIQAIISPIEYVEKIPSNWDEYFEVIVEKLATSRYYFHQEAIDSLVLYAEKFNLPDKYIRSPLGFIRTIKDVEAWYMFLVDKWGCEADPSFTFKFNPEFFNWKSLDVDGVLHLKLKAHINEILKTQFPPPETGKDEQVAGTGEEGIGGKNVNINVNVTGRGNINQQVGANAKREVAIDKEQGEKGGWWKRNSNKIITGTISGLTVALITALIKYLW